MAELTIAAGGVRALLDVAVSRGASRAALLERAGLTAGELADGDDRIPFPKYVALMKAGQKLCGDPALGLHFGESVDLAEISFTHVIGATSISDGVAMLNRYARLTVDVGDENTDRYVMKRIGGQLWLIDNRRNANAFPELTESGFARMTSTMRRSLGSHQVLKAVHFTHEAPAYRAEYDRIFGVPVVFESDRNALLLDDAVMNLKLPMAPASVAKVLTDHAEELLDRLESSKSVRNRVERMLMESLKDGDIGIDSIAGKLGLSRQTLFRRLKSENTSYENVLDDLRHSLALNYLEQGKMSVSQTSYLVGFSDPAAFSRAFKRWTGKSPRAYLARPI